MTAGPVRRKEHTVASNPGLDAAIAATRFGLGARPGEIEAAAGDPRGYLLAQIKPDGADRFPTEGDTPQRIAELRAYRQARTAARQAKVTRAGGPAEPAADPVAEFRKLAVRDAGGDFLARARLGADSDASFRERWALFWCNHFTVSAAKPAVATVAGPYENEAIRPHVFGRFVDLLQAAETHPAMLLYLDQAQSIGPNSPASLRRVRLADDDAPPRGLNENLAREILELHTVGVEGGYTQGDVTEFARAMTGLGVGGLGANRMEPGQAVFRPGAHEPGARRVMAVDYGAGDARRQTLAILSDLAARPQTARFVCAKIARHFVADTPDPALVAQLEAAWTKSGGDLAQVAAALVAAPQAWAPQPAKFKAPYEFVVSCYRAAGVQPTAIGKLAPILTGLGQRPFSAPSPKGWPEEAEAWAAPDAIVKRMQYAQAFSAAAVLDRDPSALAEQALGARLAPATAQAIARAETRAEGLALLLMSPEFQRR